MQSIWSNAKQTMPISTFIQIGFWNSVLLWLRFSFAICFTMILRLISSRFRRAVPYSILFSCLKLISEYALFEICRLGGMVEEKRNEGILLLRNCEFATHVGIHALVFFSSFFRSNKIEVMTKSQDSLDSSCRMINMQKMEIQEMRRTIEMMKMQRNLEVEAMRKDQQHSLALQQRYAAMRVHSLPTSIMPQPISPLPLETMPKMYDNSSLIRREDGVDGAMRQEEELLVDDANSYATANEMTKTIEYYPQLLKPAKPVTPDAPLVTAQIYNTVTSTSSKRKRGNSMGTINCMAMTPSLNKTNHYNSSKKPKKS